MVYIYTTHIYWIPHTTKPLGYLPETKSKALWRNTPTPGPWDSERKSASEGDFILKIYITYKRIIYDE